MCTKRYLEAVGMLRDFKNSSQDPDFTQVRNYSVFWLLTLCPVLFYCDDCLFFTETYEIVKGFLVLCFGLHSCLILRLSGLSQLALQVWKLGYRYKLALSWPLAGADSLVCSMELWEVLPDWRILWSVAVRYCGCCVFKPFLQFFSVQPVILLCESGWKMGEEYMNNSRTIVCFILYQYQYFFMSFFNLFLACEKTN